MGIFMQQPEMINNSSITRMNQNLIVIGGGAAGFFCAVNAARNNPSLKVIIVEKSNKLLSKVKVSGGGRCNVTHACFEINELIKHYPRGQNFLKKAFHWFNTKDTILWFKERGVELRGEADGRMFPITNNSQTIIDCLLNEADKYGVEVLTDCEIKEIEVSSKLFYLHSTNHQLPAADFLCIATGGYAKASKFDWLRQSGHVIEDTVPSLFTFNIPANKITELMGVSVDETLIKINDTKFRQNGPLLITHWGMSGPVILKLSAWAARDLANKNYNFNITINWIPDYNENSLREQWPNLRNELGIQKVVNRNPFGLPNRLWLYLLEESNIEEEIRWVDLSSKHQNKLIQNLTAQTFHIKGKTTFKEEFVTCGGINLGNIDANTMQSKKIDHLFFAGEVIDVDGITGGFNFQNAWTTGWIAAKSIAADCLYKKIL
jgi:predicted Rossmann fold flavoprotein